MKTIYLIRHAKSSWKDSTLDDFDRPLNKRGKKDAPLMGLKLKEKNIKPDIIISSPALRAKTTAEFISNSIKYNKEIIYDETIYEASTSELISLLKRVDDEHNTIFLVGHNPSLNMLADYFVDFEENIPTCGILQIKIDCGRWSDINSSNAKLISFDFPKKN